MSESKSDVTYGSAQFMKWDPKKETNNDRKELMEVFPELVDEYVNYIQKEFDLEPKMLRRIAEMLMYTNVGGKNNRAIIVLTTVRALAGDQKVPAQVQRRALVLGWCIEILQAHFLVADDIMDESLTRRGAPCWYLRPDIKMDAINDALLLESFLYYLLRFYFKKGEDSSVSKEDAERFGDMYVELMELYHFVSLQTQIGQMLDLTSQPQGRRDPKLLDGFTLKLYKQIVRYKTAIYSFYLPYASGLILSGFSDKKILDATYKFSCEIGEKFQIQDDYLDCYGDPEKIGKIGTDIKDHKCSWLVVQALLKMSKEQRAFLEKHYGKDEPEHEKAIKQLYKDLDLQSIYDEQEEASLKRCQDLIAQTKDVLPADIFTPILKRIHGREK